MRKTIHLGLTVAFGLALFGGLTMSAPAQQPPADVLAQNVPSVECHDADVKEVLRFVFRHASVSYAISPDVQGTVNVSLKNVTLETALQNILRQVDATYRIENGVINVIGRCTEGTPEPKGTIADPLPPKGKTMRRIKIRSTDPMFIVLLLGQTGGHQDYMQWPERSTFDSAEDWKRRGFGGGFSGSRGFDRLGSGSSGDF